MSLDGETVPLVADAGVGVVAHLRQVGEPLSGVDLFANIRWAYKSSMGGLADTAVALDGYTRLVQGNGAALTCMSVESGATFVF